MALPMPWIKLDTEEGNYRSLPLFPLIAKPAVYKAHGDHPLGVARVCGDAFRRSVQSWLDGSGRVLLVLLVRMVLVQRADGVKTGSALPPSPLALPLDRDPPEGCVANLPYRASGGRLPLDLGCFTCVP